MQRQRREIKSLLMLIMLALIIFLMFIVVVFDIQNKRHKETIKIYEEYYVLDGEMDILHRNWAAHYQHYSEEEYYLKFRTEKYLRYLELKKIIGDFEK